jgi:hypothetical protein
MTTGPAGVERAVLKRDDDDSLHPLGRVAQGARGQLTLLSASPGYEGPLRNILAAVNAQEQLRVKVPPPPGSEPYALHVRTVTRDDADLADALKDYLEQKYGLVLADDAAGPPGEG